MGRPVFSSIPHSSRSFFNFRYRILIVLCLLALFIQQHLYAVHRQSLVAKYSPTTFSFDSEGFYSRLQRPDDEDAQFQEEIIANRAAWRALGAGWEGKVFVYKDSVIKTFFPRSPARNCAPGADDNKWPTEIPASLYFGGTVTNTNNNNNEDTSLGANGTSEGFLPVKAYFKASDSPSGLPEWHLVTPLLKEGNLEALAKKLSKNDQALSFRDLDALHRPAFNRLLLALRSLHNQGYCHDDIKPGNIFIQDQAHWVLGDLGNLRNVHHPYHTSRLWKDNQQLGDCRANDVVRILKTYLKFIQSSVANDEDYNQAIYDSQEPISRLLWWTLSNMENMTAAELRRRSLIEYPEAPRSVGIDDAFSVPIPCNTMLSHPAATRKAVSRTLQTRMGEKIARWWAMVWLFGLPIADHC